MYKLLHIDNNLDHHDLIKKQLANYSDDLHLDLFKSMEAAGDALKDERYQCILTDEEMLGQGGVQLLHHLRSQGEMVPFVVLIDYAEEDQDTYLSAYAEDEFNIAVNTFKFDLVCLWIKRLIEKYEQYLESKRLLKDLFQAAPGKITELKTAKENLTSREIEILDLIAAGLSNHDIADRLCISYRTVKNHIYNLFSKLGIHSRAEAIQLAVSLKLLEKNS